MFRIEEAIARAKQNGKKVYKKDIAARLWPDSEPIGQQVNMTRLCAGKNAKIDPQWIVIVCEMTGVTADFLLGISNE